MLSLDSMISLENQFFQISEEGGITEFIHQEGSMGFYLPAIINVGGKEVPLLFLYPTEKEYTEQISFFMYGNIKRRLENVKLPEIDEGPYTYLGSTNPGIIILNSEPGSREDLLDHMRKMKKNQIKGYRFPTCKVSDESPREA